MTTMTVKIQNVDELFGDMRQASQGEALGNIVSFESYQAFAKFLTPNRLELIEALLGEEPMTVRQLADKLGRGIRRTHDDVSALAQLGLITTGRGNIAAPYDELHIDVTIKAHEAA